MKTMCGKISFSMSLKAALVLHVRLHVPWVLPMASGQSDFSQGSTVEFSPPWAWPRGPEQSTHL